MVSGWSVGRYRVTDTNSKMRVKMHLIFRGIARVVNSMHPYIFPQKTYRHAFALVHFENETCRHVFVPQKLQSSFFDVNTQPFRSVQSVDN